MAGRIRAGAQTGAGVRAGRPASAQAGGRTGGPAGRWVGGPVGKLAVPASLVRKGRGTVGGGGGAREILKKTT